MCVCARADSPSSPPNNDNNEQTWVILSDSSAGLFRGIFELLMPFLGAYTGASGLTWSHFGDSKNRMEAVLLIFFFEWVIFVVVGILMHDESYYKALLSPRFRKKKGGFVEMQEIKAKATDRIAPVDIEAEVQSDDVAEERKKVASLINKQHKGPILASGLRKVFNVGNSVKVACDGVDLGVEDGECIGLLGRTAREDHADQHARQLPGRHRGGIHFKSEHQTRQGRHL